MSSSKILFTFMTGIATGVAAAYFAEEMACPSPCRAVLGSQASVHRQRNRSYTDPSHASSARLSQACQSQDQLQTDELPNAGRSCCSRARAQPIPHSSKPPTVCPNRRDSGESTIAACQLGPVLAWPVHQPSSLWTTFSMAFCTLIAPV